MGMGLRRGSQSKWLHTEDGQLLGISFGADFCAEHEWGIKTIKQIFAINDSYVGVMRREAFAVPSAKHFRHGTIKVPTSRRASAKKVDVHILRAQDYFHNNQLEWYGGRSELIVDDYFRDPVCLWSDSGFAIATLNKAALDQMISAIEQRDVCIGLFGGMAAFGNPGLTILIKSRIPADVAAQWTEADLDAIELQKASDETGIIAKLAAFNIEQKAKGHLHFQTPCTYFACSPRWNNDKKAKTKWRVVYWLNPCNQSENQYGWYTAEELELWMEGKGPVKQMDKRN